MLMKNRLAQRAVVLLAAAVGVMSFGLPQGRCDVNLYWIGGSSVQYDDGQNWSYDEGTNVLPAFAVPGTGNFAVFEQSAAISFSDYTASQQPTPDSLQILNGSVTFTLGPISYQDAVARTYTTNGLSVVAPFEDGTYLQSYNLPNGANSTLFVSGGTLVVNGSAVIGGGSSNNVGTLTLQASQLQLTAGLSVAQTAHGNLNIESASYVTSSGGNVAIGGQFGSIGTATVSGGSTWLLDGSAPLGVGVQGTGSLLVEGGSLVSGVTLNIGSTGPTPASVTVDGAGTQLNFPNLSVGTGNGTLTIQNGASVTSGGSDNTSIGALNGSTGAATVTGSGSNWTTNGLAVGGGSGQGSLIISGGASVTSTDYLANVNGTSTLISSSVGGSQSSVQVVGNGSTWTLTGGLSVSPFGGSTASLTVGAGSAVNIANTLQVSQGGTVQVDGTLNAATLNMYGGSFTQTGTVCIGGANLPPASVDDQLKIGSSGQVTIDGGASLNVNGVDIEGGSLDVYSGQVNGSGGGLTVAAHGEYVQSIGDFNASTFNNVTVNGALLNIQNGSLNVGSGQTLAATNGAIVCAANGSLNIGVGGYMSAINSTVNVSNLYVGGNLSLTNASLQAQSVTLDGGTIATSTPLSIDSTIQGNGTINGDLQLAGGTLVANGGSLAISGSVSGYGVLVGNVVTNSLTPSGDLTISGNHNNLGSQSAVLLSTHAASLSGTLNSDGGTLTSASGIVVAAGGAISGNITINGNVENDGLLDVGGDAIGLDTIDGNLVLDNGGTVRIKIAGTDASDYDHIMVVDGDVTLGGTLELDFIDGFLPMQGDEFNIFIDDFSGSFSQLQVEGLGTWQYSVTPGSSGVTLDSLSDAAPVPEPSTVVLLAVGGLLLMVYRKRLRKFAEMT
jgi:T5SS/PEP-CTERM-associated repeat protein